MFLTLPLEITLNICGHLEFKDKLALKTTCTRINGLITKATLYETLNLLDSKYGVISYRDRDKAGDNIIQKLVNDQFDGSFVRVLHLDIDKLSDPVVSQLSDVFPNVKRIITAKAINRYESSRDYTHLQKFNKVTITPLIKWRNTIDKVISNFDWSQLKIDLMWSKYPRLTELDLGGLEDVLNFCINNKDVSFFANAPLLTTLTLRDATLNLEILEEIHAGFPLLKSLRLFGARAELNVDAALPLSIAPANNLLFLGLFDPKNFYKGDVILDYMRKKYTNLQQLVYSIYSADDYFIKSRDDFKGYFPCSDHGYEEMVSAGIASSEANFAIHSATESKFFSNLPKSIKHLTLDLNNVDSAVAALAESNMEITTLDLLSRSRDTVYKREWKDPNMLSHFQKLISLKTLKIKLNSFIQTFKPEFISVTITRLFIDISILGGPFYINWTLSMFPSLEELTIKALKYNVKDLLECNIRGKYRDSSDDSKTKSMRPEKEYPQLRILTIERCPIHPGFFDFIKTSVPNLEELNLDMNLMTSSLPSPPPISYVKAEKVDLSNWYLKKCNLSFHCLHSVLAIHFIVTIQNTLKHFIIDLKNNSLLPDEKTYRMAQLSPYTVWMEVTADHIPHLKISGYRITKIGDSISINI